MKSIGPKLQNAQPAVAITFHGSKHAVENMLARITININDIEERGARVGCLNSGKRDFCLQ